MRSDREGQIVKRERVDLEGPPRVSVIHKLWSDGHEEIYAIEESSDDSIRNVPVPSHWKSISKTAWVELISMHRPIQVFANSDWGTGLPGVPDFPVDA